MKKRILLMLLAIVMVMALLPTVALATDNHNTHCLCQVNDCTVDHNGNSNADDHQSVAFTAVSTYDDLADAANTGGSYYLTNNIQLTSTIEVTSNLNLCLNGHSIAPHANFTNGRAFKVESAVTFNLTDCGTTGAITGFKINDNDGGAGVLLKNGAKFNMYGGSISGNISSSSGGGVAIYNSSVEVGLYGGEITDNRCGNYGLGGGVFARDYQTNIKIAGNPKVADNTNGTRASNCSRVKFEIVGKLEETAKLSFYSDFGDNSIISVGKYATGVTGNYESCFVHDNWDSSKYVCEKDANGNISMFQFSEITFDANGGTGTMDSQKVPLGQYTTLNRNTFTPPSGKVFSYWSYNENGGGPDRFQDGGMIKRDSATQTILYAIWGNPTYSISTNSGITNGSVNVKSSAAADEIVTVTVTPDDGYAVNTVTVKDADNNAVTVTDKGNGTYSFTMPAEAVTVSVTFKSSIVPVTGVSLNASEIDLTVDHTETLTPTVTPADATNQAVTWTSSDSTVATVRNGVVTAVAPGTATITVTTADGSYTDTCAVTVGYPLWVGGVQVSPTNADDVLDDGTVSFNPTTNTLTLDNFHCTIEDTDDYYAGVETSIEDLTILLRGNNSITVENYGNGIVAYRNVTIRDDDTDNSVGSLQITSYYKGLCCWSDLNVENVRLDVASEGNVGIVCDGNFKVVNSVIDAVGDDGAISCYTLPNLNGEHKVYTGSFKPELVEVENPDESDYEELCVRIAPSSFVYYPVWIGETQFTSDCLTIAGDSGTATLTVGNDNGTPTYTLTLANFSYSGEGILYSGGEAVRCYCALFTNEDLTIQLRGNNALSCTGDYEHGYYDGIVAYGDLTICDDPNHSGMGKLAVNSGNYGIDAWKNFDVLNCSLDVTVDGGDRDWMEAIGIYTENEINIQGSEVTVTVGAATDEYGYSYGICEADGVTVEDGTLIVTAADQAFYSDYEITVHAENAIVYVGVDEASAEAAGPVSDDDKREFDTYTNKYVRIEHTAPVYFDPAYPVVENKGEDPDGTVKLSSNYSTPGSTVTVTVTPDKYYGVEKIIVRDASGKEIETTKNADGTYSFKMPSGKVTVEAVYVWENPFVDVEEETFYIDAVEWALKNGITQGTSETTFSPVASCTRAQMVTFLWRAAGCPEPKTNLCSFTDIDADSYYAKAVQWALENGITSGTSKTAFSPDMECSRAQMAAFLCRMADGKAESDENTFDDVKADAYYAKAVQWALENGVTSGTGNNMFSPDAVCTRGQMVTFLYRHFGK